MPSTGRELIAELKDVLTRQQYSPVVVRNYCAYGRGFLDYLARSPIAIADVTEAHVAHYLRHATRCFRKRHGRPPGPHWHAIPRSGIHALLRLAQGQWPPAPRVTCAADALRFLSRAMAFLLVSMGCSCGCSPASRRAAGRMGARESGRGGAAAAQRGAVRLVSLAGKEGRYPPSRLDDDRIA